MFMMGLRGAPVAPSCEIKKKGKNAAHSPTSRANMDGPANRPSAYAKAAQTGKSRTKSVKKPENARQAAARAPAKRANGAPPPPTKGTQTPPAHAPNAPG